MIKMLKSIILFLIIAFVVATAAPFVSADCGLKHTSVTNEDSEAGEVVNAVCPIMGAEVKKDTPYKVEYEGKTIGFCCAGCITTFKADPEKYMKNLEEASQTDED